MATNNITLQVHDFDISRIGIDKIQLSNFRVLDIDFAYLSGLSNVDIYWDNTGLVRKIIIKDNEIFNDLVLGRFTGSNGWFTTYSHLTLSVKNVIGTNLQSLSHQQYDDHIDSTLAYIQHVYHIVLDASEIKVDYLEIAATIALEHPFPSYQRPLRLIASFISRKTGKLNSVINDKSTGNASAVSETIMRSNKSFSVIIYDKTKQLYETNGTIVEDNGRLANLLRLELRLLQGAKIANVFGTRAWANITDAMIADYYWAQIQTLHHKYTLWMSDTSKKLRREIKKLKTEKPKTWHHILIASALDRESKTGVPYILDCTQILDALSCLPDRHGNRSRTWHTILRTLASIPNCCLCNQDCDKMDEIFNKIEHCCRFQIDEDGNNLF